MLESVETGSISRVGQNKFPQPWLWWSSLDFLPSRQPPSPCLGLQRNTQFWSQQPGNTKTRSRPSDYKTTISTWDDSVLKIF